MGDWESAPPCRHNPGSSAGVPWNDKQLEKNAAASETRNLTFKVLLTLVTHDIGFHLRLNSEGRGMRRSFSFVAFLPFNLLCETSAVFHQRKRGPE